MVFKRLLLFAVGVSHGFCHLHHSLTPPRLPLARFLLRDAAFVAFLLQQQTRRMIVFTTTMFLLAIAVDPDQDLMLVREKPVLWIRDNKKGVEKISWLSFFL
jgi:hypothetical protein